MGVYLTLPLPEVGKEGWMDGGREVGRLVGCWVGGWLPYLTFTLGR